MEKKDKTGRRIAPLPFITQNGLSFINGYRQHILTKLSNLGVDTRSNTSTVITASLLSNKSVSQSEHPNIFLGHWLSLLASTSNVVSESLYHQYISQALNLELFLSSLSQQKHTNTEILGMPSISDLHATPDTIPESIINHIGRSFGSLDEFKKTVGFKYSH